MGGGESRMTSGVRALALLLAVTVSPVGGAASAATQIVQINANVAKPLQLTRIQDLDLGTVTLKPGAWSGATVSITNGGTFACTNVNVVCSGAPKQAMYNLQGTNKTVVKITAPSVTLVNQADASKTLTLILDSPGTVTLTSSGVPGNDFGIGGSVTLNSAAADGTYAGTLNVTVDF